MLGRKASPSEPLSCGRMLSSGFCGNPALRDCSSMHCCRFSLLCLLKPTNSDIFSQMTSILSIVITAKRKIVYYINKQHLGFKELIKDCASKLGVVAHTFSPSSQQAEAGTPLSSRPSGLHSEFQTARTILNPPPPKQNKAKE